MGLLHRAGDLLGGGLAAPALIAGGLLLVFVAYKLATTIVRLVVLALGAGLLAGVAPWSGAPPVTGDVAACAVAETVAALSGPTALATKRVTVRSLSPDAACADGDGLASGSAEVVLRTVYDVPIATRTVTAVSPTA